MPRTKNNPKGLNRRVMIPLLGVAGVLGGLAVGSARAQDLTGGMAGPGFGTTGMPGPGFGTGGMPGTGLGMTSLPGGVGGGFANVAGWTIAPALNVKETYDDNIALSPPGQERSDFATEVNPQISISKKAPRLDALLNYRMQNIFYARNSASDATFHQLFGKLDSELVKRTFFVNAQATSSQELISPSQPIALSNVAITSNRTNVTTYSITPQLQHEFGSMAVARARYSYSAVDYRTQQLTGSQTQDVGGSLGTGPGFSEVDLNVNYDRQRTNFDAAQDVIFERLVGEARYPVQSRFRLVLRGGYEDNNYDFGPLVPTPKGKLWSAGFEWDLTPRTLLEAGYGRRFFGSTYYGSFRHEGASTTASISYREEPTTVSATVLSQQPLVVNPNNQLVQVLSPSLPELSAQVFISRQVTGNFSVHGVRDTVGLTLSRAERTYQVFQTRETVDTVTGAWYRRLGPRTTTSVSGSWDRRNFPGSDRVDSLWAVRGDLNYELARHAVGTLSVDHIQRDSNSASDQYVSNLVSLSVTLVF